MSSEQLVLTDRPADGVVRFTLNRGRKRNALSNELRRQLIAALEGGDGDPAVRVMIIRGDGPAFSAGYDLSEDVTAGDLPFHTSGGIGQWARHVTDTWMRISDLAKPVIAQVHGYCLAGGSELAACCDLVYVADDAQIGYPPVRMMSSPDNQIYPWLIGMRATMEMWLTGDSISGARAAELGFANRAFPLAELEAKVLEIAARVALVPTELAQINKRAVHRAMEIQGLRTAVRYGTELQALSMTTQTAQDYIAGFFDKTRGVTHQLSQRDAKFGDYRESGA